MFNKSIDGWPEIVRVVQARGHFHVMLCMKDKYLVIRKGMGHRMESSINRPVVLTLLIVLLGMGAFGQLLLTLGMGVNWVLSAVVISIEIFLIVGIVNRWKLMRFLLFIVLSTFLLFALFKLILYLLAPAVYSTIYVVESGVGGSAMKIMMLLIILYFLSKKNVKSYFRKIHEPPIN